MGIFIKKISWIFFFFPLSQKGDREKQNEDIKKKKKSNYLQTLCYLKDCILHGIFQANTGVGRYSVLHGIFPIQELNPGVPHCRQILFQLSHQGRPRILEWVAYPFSRGYSQPRNQTGISCIAGRFFTS